MKKLPFLLICFLSLSAIASAQVDSTLVGTGLYGYMPSNVTVKQSSAIRDSYLSVSQKNADSQTFTGFRIRLYQSSAQSARAESESVLAVFSENFPSIPVDRTYESPYFKVTAGCFRTRVDAEKALRQVRSTYPTASIVKEKMKYPSL